MAKSIKELENMVLDDAQPKGTTKIEKQFYQGGVTRSFYVVEKSITDKIKEFERGCGEIESLGSAPCQEGCTCHDCDQKIQALKELLEGY